MQNPMPPFWPKRLLRRGLPTGVWAVGVLLASGFVCSLTDNLGARQHPRLPRVVPQFLALRGGLGSSENGAGGTPQPAPPSAPQPAPPFAGDASGEAVRAEEDGEDDFSLGAVSGGRASEEADGAGQDPASAADDVTEGCEGPGANAGEDAAGGDDADVVECNFERIGDTNGVFYYLGLQECAEPTDDAVAQALRLAAPAVHRGPGNHEPQRRFRNPAITGRVQVKTPLSPTL